MYDKMYLVKFARALGFLIKKPKTVNNCKQKQCGVRRSKPLAINVEIN